jgi:hypothetical protein
MPSRADATAVSGTAGAPSVAGTLRAVGTALHVVALVCVALLLWRALASSASDRVGAAVSADGTLDTSLATLLRARTETISVALAGVPDARARAVLRALRGSGHVIRLTTSRPLSSTAVTAEDEWRALGGTRIQAVSSDSVTAAVSDGAGLLDTLSLGAAGGRTRSGPLQGALHMTASASRAGVGSLRATMPLAARVLVVGDASWESRFVVAALEEDGWPVDLGLSLSPKVTIEQGSTRAPSIARHAVVIVLSGAPASAVAALPAFVRAGGGVIIVGDAARIAGLAVLRAGTPSVAVAGEAGAEASTTPRDGLDLDPIGVLSPGSVALERRDGRVAVAARRIGAGRVVQVGYQNSWLWRMAGNDDAPVAHRRWWTALASSVIALRAPVRDVSLDAEHDTLDAAPVSALARDIGLPTIQDAAVVSSSRSFGASLDPRWLLVLALVSLVASWTLRRWRGLA